MSSSKYLSYSVLYNAYTFEFIAVIDKIFFRFCFSFLFFLYIFNHSSYKMIFDEIYDPKSFVHVFISKIRKKKTISIYQTHEKRERETDKKNEQKLKLKLPTFAYMYVCGLFIDLRILLITNHLHLIRIKSLSINECFLSLSFFPFFDCCHINNS